MPGGGTDRRRILNGRLAGIGVSSVSSKARERPLPSHRK